MSIGLEKLMEAKGLCEADREEVRSFAEFLALRKRYLASRADPSASPADVAALRGQFIAAMNSFEAVTDHGPQ